ncbi:unnamed protein product [Prunus armeniaca]|uniref:Uncharacterized protein n=1 Tax=Prunus armeniaca TaxID=36596 RepID=A0A6J5UU79_PRUAR|nr:unnamed protein product [Prunus armeniaca]
MATDHVWFWRENIEDELENVFVPRSQPVVVENRCFRLGGRDESNGTNGTVWGGWTTTKSLAQYEVALHLRGRRERKIARREKVAKI